MSTTIIISLIGAGLLLMIGIAYFIQVMEKNNQEKQRLMFALRERAEHFKLMLENFPKGFLTSDLQLLMCKCLLDILDQLVANDKRNRQQHTESIAQTTQLFEQIKANPSQGGYQSLNDTKHIQQVQKMLSALYKFIVNLREANKLSEAEAIKYAQQIRRLNVISSVDAYRLASNVALNEGKPRLAVHHQLMSIDKMKKENGDGFFNERIEAAKARLSDLNDAVTALEEAEKQSLAKSKQEWDKFQEQSQQEEWKKKAIYD